MEAGAPQKGGCVPYGAWLLAGFPRTGTPRRLSFPITRIVVVLVASQGPETPSTLALLMRGQWTGPRAYFVSPASSARTPQGG
jgi:hypothetical protein